MPINTSMIKSLSVLPDFLSRFGLFKQVILLSVFLNGFSLCIPLFIMVLYNTAINTQSYSSAVNFMIGALIVLMGITLLQGMRREVVTYIGTRLGKAMDDETRVRLLSLSPTMIESATVGVQIARIKDFDSIKSFFTGNLALIVLEIPFILVYTMALAVIGKALVLVPLAMLGVFLGLYLFLYPTVLLATEKKKQSHLTKQNFQIEALSQLRILKTAAYESIWENRFESYLAKACTDEYKQVCSHAMMDALTEFLMLFTGLSLVLFGVLAISNGELTVGALAASLMLSWHILRHVKVLFSIFPNLNQIKSSITEMNALIQCPLEQGGETAAESVPPIKGNIDFMQVSFAYQPEFEPALQEISFTIPAGEWVCIAGKNGSGKSTLLKMIPALYAPQTGGILIDRKAVNNGDVIALRQALAYMPQQTTLFYGTVLQNILLANPKAPFHKIVYWAKKIGIYEEIMRLPYQFNTLVHAQAAGKLPASFEQKLGLLRVLIKEAGILLLDEPGTSLNAEDDKHLMALLNELKGEKTILMATHRPGHMKQCDRILFLDRGKLQLNGSPQNVLDTIRSEME